MVFGKPTNTAAIFKHSALNGTPLWASDVLPESAHDLTTAHAQVLGALYRTASHLDLPTLANNGYDDAGIDVHTPSKQPTGNQVLDNRTHNALLRGLRCLGEHGFAVLTERWRVLQHLTTNPSKIGTIVQAALVLTQFEHGQHT
ncbi:transposase family protein [Actinophytocola sp.]|uniref:transposase family protein n=1 Tax=Actinophytocola sp. TaxID=1872138 RepID=UPI00389B3453